MVLSKVYWSRSIGSDVCW